MAYKPISSYGVVGDLHSAALINEDGSVEWFCLPRFDSPSIFAALLDEGRGGHFRIMEASNEARYQQLYKPETNILVTRLLTPRGVAEVTDFMPPRANLADPHHSRLVRRVKAVSGEVALKVECVPGFNYAEDKHEVKLEQGGALFRSSESSFFLASSVPLQADGPGARAELILRERESASFIFGPGEGRERGDFAIVEAAVDELEEETSTYWKAWLSKCSYTGRWRHVVHRSALLLELLTYAPSGAVIAAPTCSLPEWIGGTRNWDYRYNWIRDAAYTIYALLRIGLFDEAARFMSWIEERCGELADGDFLQTVYTVGGERDLRERTLDHLSGYRNSGPVRVGNDAVKQLQLDIYGALIDAVYLYNKYVEPISWGLWKDVRRLVDWVCDNWQQEDRGIWEVRGDPKHFVHSKVMCWVALDRGARLSAKRSLPADVDRWLCSRDRVYEEVLDKGWSRERRSFVQSYGSPKLDAAVLMMPLVFFMAPNDPMMISTVDAICQPLAKGGLMSDGMVYRYDPSVPEDGLIAGEGTFNVCTMWLVETLTRMGKLEEAEWMFEKMLLRTNHAGLMSEETADGSNEALGNFPQALSHIGMISAAYNLDRAMGGDKKSG